MDLLGDLPGLPGLFIACVYSAALRLITSNEFEICFLKTFFLVLYPLVSTL